MTEIVSPPPPIPLSPLVDVLAAARQTKRLAVDTEFVRDRTYFPELALVQVAARSTDGVLVAIVDPMSKRSALDLEAVADVLSDDTIVKWFHSASQDYDVLRFVLGVVPSPVFDTQIAASEVELGRQLAYGALIETVLGIPVEKGSQRADWLRRPLSDALVQYAAADVFHLVPAAEALEDRVQEASRSEAVAARCAHAVAEARRDETPAELIERIKGSSRLEPATKRRLQALAIWRETEAKSHNLPRRWLAEDDVLMAVAKAAPVTLADLAHVRQVPATMRSRFGAALISLMSQPG